MEEVNRHSSQPAHSAEETYTIIHSCIITTQNKVAAAANVAMMLAYHEIGEQVYKAYGENDRAECGKRLFRFLSEQLTAEFGKGFTIRNLQMMQKFYLIFPNVNALRSELSWTHYRMLMHIQNDKERKSYLHECAKSG